ncbi:MULTISPECIES: S16 family serine protease [Paenibacillus]|uniref:Lon proteolytic domain-containing protein n=1 Tax=Paenibacillus vandeheii TaxID=3035917 RepID=A0ABT8JFX3_9BACL|nr:MULTISPECIES: S16 family serine protease [Paenibacillus]KGP78299.1 hypothetical protein P363_0132290 [Paenibacillus sp. MAEPY1]KGP78429.1 hypothetical protein P364_0128745 [Paenibacillus sp. MAEPY2]MDN4604013.1 hypothetical protein [Paenibacillus vandeheii]
MNSEAVKTIDKTTRKRTRSIALSIIAIMLVALAALPLYTYLKPIELRTYELPGKLYPAQELFRYPSEDSIYIPSVNVVKVSRLSDYLFLKVQYGGLLQEFEEPKQQEGLPYEPQLDPPGSLKFPDTEQIRESLLYVALPAYISGSNEANVPIQYGYEFEIGGVPSEVDNELLDLLGSTIVTIDDYPPTLEKVEEILASKELHKIEGRSYDGKTVFLETALYGTTVNVHYTIKELWKFSDLMKFDLANIEGNSGGAATAYEVMLKQREEPPKDHGKFLITGAIDAEGNISGVGGVKGKTYLAIKNSIPVMFVPKGMNYAEAMEMKSLMKSDIDIVPIQKLGNIEAYWL